MRERNQDIIATGAQVVIITPSSRKLLEPFIEAFGPYPFSIYGDPQRELYRSMGHKTMQKWKLILKAAKAYLKGGAKAFMPAEENQQKVVKEAMKTQDIYIQGGSWIFNEQGKIIWSHVDDMPENHAKITDIMKQLS